MDASHERSVQLAEIRYSRYTQYMLDVLDECLHKMLPLSIRGASHFGTKLLCDWFLVESAVCSSFGALRQSVKIAIPHRFENVV